MLQRPLPQLQPHQVVDHHGEDLHSQVEEVVVELVVVVKVVPVFKAFKSDN